jgi:hypothetical protein
MALTTYARYERIQQRAEWNMATCGAYQELYEEGRDLGALVAFYDVETGLYVLADSFHRHAAAQFAGLTTLPVDVYDGTYRDALLYATSHNLHGAPLTNRDKRRRVRTMVKDEEWHQWSDNQIAKHCGVTQPFVSAVRKSLRTVISEGASATPTTRTYTNRYGQTRTMAVGNIGHTAPVTTDNAAAEAVLAEMQASPTAKEAREVLSRHVGVEQENGTPSEASTGRPAPAIFTAMQGPEAADAITLSPVRFGSGVFEWYTPPEVIDRVRAVLGLIDLDPASCDAAQQVVGATTYYTVADDGLRQPWTGRVFCNPPYKTPEIARFIGKLVAELDADHITEAILLVNATTETDWFQFVAPRATLICFPDGRLHFTSATHTGTSSCYGQALLYFGPHVERFAEVFASMGFLTQPCRAKDPGPQLDLAAPAPAAPAITPAPPGTIAEQLVAALRAAPAGMTEGELTKVLGKRVTDTRFGLKPLLNRGLVRPIGTTKTYRLVAPKEAPDA